MKLTNEKGLTALMGPSRIFFPTKRDSAPTTTRLIEPHPDPSDQTPEALVLLAKELLVLLGRRAGGLHADPGHALDHLRGLHCGVYRTVEPRNDLARGARDDEHAQRGRHVEAGRHRLRDRRDLGCEV